MATEGRGLARRKGSMRRVMRSVCCCACIRPRERQSYPTAAGGPRGHQAAGEDDWEGVQITVEDLGTENPGFEPTEEGNPAKVRRGVGHSASLAWACQRAWRKRNLAPVSSLPPPSGRGSPCKEGGADSPRSVGNEEGTEGGADCTLLSLPLINLIPPSPSDVIDDDQFFDLNSEEESVSYMSGSEGVDSASSQALEEQDCISEQDHKPLGWGVESEPDPHTEEPSWEDEEPESKSHPVPAATGHGSTSGESLQSSSDQEEYKDLTQGEDEQPVREPATHQAKQRPLRSAFQVPPLPEYPRKRSFNTGISLLQFTEQNLDDLNNKDVSDHKLLQAKLRLLPLDTKMDLRKPAARTCSLGDHVTRSHTYHSVTKGPEETPEEEGSPRQRRITVASYIPETADRNGNLAEKQHKEGNGAKPLVELGTEEVCQWFASIGLHKCLPFIRGASLCGSHIASIDASILEVLHVSALEEREVLLSAIYRELHPPDCTTQELDSLLDSIGPHDVDKFTAALVSMSKSKSAPQVNCVSAVRSSFKFRERSRHSIIERTSHLVEISINGLEQIVHLRTPRDTMVGKVLDSCLKTLGVTDNRGLYSLRNKDGPFNELSFEQQIGDLLGSDKRLLELHLSKKGNLNPKEEKIQELKQHVESLQNVIHQVAQLHQSLVTFCGELKNMEEEPSHDALCVSDVEIQLGRARGQLQQKQQRVQAMLETVQSLETHKNRRLEVQLLDKMKLDCEIFKEEICIIHLNRQVARLKSAVVELQAKEHSKKKGSILGQLVSPHSPAILLMSHETETAQGKYGFTVRFTLEAGLVVADVGNTQLCVNDRLVEVNGVNVLESAEDELRDLLSRCSSARIVVLRKPPPLPPKPGRGAPVSAWPLGEHPPTAPHPHCRVIST